MPQQAGGFLEALILILKYQFVALPQICAEQIWGICFSLGTTDSAIKHGNRKPLISCCGSREK
jgi:hypothetical protein